MRIAFHEACGLLGIAQDLVIRAKQDRRGAGDLFVTFGLRGQSDGNGHEIAHRVVVAFGPERQLPTAINVIIAWNGFGAEDFLAPKAGVFDRGGHRKGAGDKAPHKGIAHIEALEGFR